MGKWFWPQCHVEGSHVDSCHINLHFSIVITFFLVGEIGDLRPEETFMCCFSILPFRVSTNKKPDMCNWDLFYLFVDVCFWLLLTILKKWDTQKIQLHWNSNLLRTNVSIQLDLYQSGSFAIYFFGENG